MPMDRQTIEKRDFPIGRRGYEPEAVDEHLAVLAEEVERLQRAGSEKRAPESLAALASQQVAAIVEAAENSAGEIERQARDAADHIRREAEADAASARADAVERSRSHVGRVSEGTAMMLQRVQAMESELDALVETLRTGSTRLQADLSLLEGNMAELYSASGAGSTRTDAVAEDARSRELPAPPAPPDAPEPPRAAAPPPPPPPPPPEPVRAAEEEVVPVATPSHEEPREPDAPEPALATAIDGAVPAAGVDEEDVEGARLIALNMALNGTSREETDRYLADNFDLSDRSTLLDEVYASVDG